MKKPLIACITDDAHLQSILLCNENFYPWIMCNFIQLRAFNPSIDKSGLFFNFIAPSYWHACPHILTQEIRKETINIKYDTITDFLTDNISLNYYVVIPIDKHYIKAYNHDKHFTHDLLVYGYDIKEKFFYIADFFDYQYSFKTCTFEEMENAYFTDKFNIYSWHNTVRLAKQDDFKMHYDFHLGAFYDFDFNIILHMLQDYISGENSIYRYRIQQAANDSYNYTVGGVKTYDILLNYFKQQLENNDCIDHRIIYIFCAHKHMMTLRAQYISNTYIDFPIDDLHMQFQNIEDKSKILLNKSLKYNIDHKNFNYCDAKIIITNIMKDEIINIEKLIDKIHIYIKENIQKM